jgi:AraC-like DNA-binding protein
MSLPIALIFLLLSIVLLYYNWKTLPNAVYLSLSLLVMGLIFIAQYIIIFDNSVITLAIIFNHVAPLYFLLGPFIFFYVRATLTDRYKLSTWDYLHFLPELILLLGILPYVFSSWNFKLEVAQALRVDFRNIIKLPNLVLYPPEINIVGRPLSVFLYTTASLTLIYQFKKQYAFQSLIPYLHAQKVIRFLFLFVMVTLLSSITFGVLSYLYLTNNSFSANAWKTSAPMQVFETLALVVFMVLLFFPEILYGIPQIASSKAKERIQSSKPILQNTQDAITKLSETPEVVLRFNELAQRIARLMENEKPYLNHDFSMDDLARLLEVPKHHLYYCFNSVLNKRFTQLRSEYRVRHAIQLIEKGEALAKTLEAIGLESGFSSRSSFFTTFKELTGMSPSDFQQKVG